MFFIVILTYLWLVQAGSDEKKRHPEGVESELILFFYDILAGNWQCLRRALSAGGIF